MHFIGRETLQQWLTEGQLSAVTQGIGLSTVDPEYLEESLGLPLHLAFVVRELLEKNPLSDLSELHSLPFYSLCRGLFLPLSAMAPQKAAAVFGLAIKKPPVRAEREALLLRFLGTKDGLDLVSKLGCVLGDPFLGKPSGMRRDSLITLLLSMRLNTRRELLDRLTVVGEIGTLYAESRRELRATPALTAAEVLFTLRFIKKKGLGRKRVFAILRSLFERTGKLEAYFLSRLIIKKPGFGFDYQSQLIARTLAEHFSAPVDSVSHAIALTDAFHVMEVLGEEGAAGLRKIRLQPLVPVRPALASGTSDGIKQFPVWVERKYDGIRFMLHKSTDSTGSVLCGAYTRNRRDWLELVPGLANTIRMLPCSNTILDGELYGTVLDHNGARPATVYEVYSALQGEGKRPVNLRFAAFDVLFLNNQDLTSLPLQQRRAWLSQLVAPLANMPTPVPFSVAEGQLAQSKDDLNRLYGHFRAQGYEGLITKDLTRPYMLSARDPSWLKRKPALTLDLVLLGAVFAVTTKANAGAFGSYVIGARSNEGGFVDVGDVAGVDVEKDRLIQQEVMREGLITGQRIERQSSSGTRPGMELRPYIVVTVRVEGLIRDNVTGDLKLRDPKLVAIRSDKGPLEADRLVDLEAMQLRQRFG